MKADSGSIYPPPYSYNMDYQWAPPIQPGYNINPALYPNGQPMVSYATQPDGTPIVTTQPNVMVIPQPAHNDYLCLSIVSLILCFLPLGVAAVIYSCKSRDSLRHGDMFSAAIDSRMAFKLNMAALGIGIAGHITWIICVIYFNLTYSHATNYHLSFSL
ncbi:proline-rich transmembrane 1-like [Pelobates cultripes]|uniref:Proline-rich transmembrane 1-like n=1 Tax=Pelobates cultripes TaxID=61616 RepID=A0AAD1VW83_PELCU|nr:proline-rich transmembrane 1-like [Pelobates cultripes]